MQSTKNQLWTEKYRPQKIQDYIFHDDNQRSSIERMIADGHIPNLLFSGVQGSGKTTIAQIIIKALEIDPMDVLTLNASDENSVEVMRDKIKNFISTFPIGKFKIVHLEEADYISLAGQAVLRRMMEDEYANTARFILTCNYEHKIIPSIKSRSQQFKFTASNKDDITEFVAGILVQEHIKFDIDLLDTYVSVGYPDIRKIINLLQQNSNNNILQSLNTTSETGDYKFGLIEAINNDDWNTARTITCKNVLAEDWDDLYKFLYENLHKSPKYKKQDKWEAGIVVIADHLYKHSIVADPEINAAAMFIRLSQI